MTATRKVSLVVAVAGLSVASAGGWWWYRTSLPREFRAVEAGRLYRCGQGRGFQVRNAIRKYGIRTVICLRALEGDDAGHWLRDEETAVRLAGADFMHWPLVSGEAPSPALREEFLALFHRSGPAPVLIHCARGIHRTGYFAAVYRMVEQGWTREQALAEMEHLGFSLSTHQGLVRALRALDAKKLRQTSSASATQPK